MPDGDLLLETLLALGAGVGLLVVLRDRRASRPATRRPDARWKRARYALRCHGCRRLIPAGERILHAPGQTLCLRCA